MNTEKLYDQDSLLFSFRARVIACEEQKSGFALALDRTAFFPEGGGQLADTGRIGEAVVSDVHEREGCIWHYADRPIEPGTEVLCEIDAEKRLRRMQNHSGEHILSGITHRLTGYDNVGFHMGADCMTIDFSGELSEDQLQQIETLANEAIRADLRGLSRLVERPASGAEIVDVKVVSFAAIVALDPSHGMPPPCWQTAAAPPVRSHGARPNILC